MRAPAKVPTIAFAKLRTGGHTPLPALNGFAVVAAKTTRGRELGGGVC